MKKEDIGTICPVCGRANDCQIGGDKKCWCFDMSVNKAKLEQALKDKSKDQCLCRNCLKKLSVQ
ncbi:cysteine-rich CWC family protein [Polynucleobacter sp. AP-Jannik-300A-C4]|uniref:cysteine-rich CWC family protein n=1 Tax=Polynucleobacter sp. AP-Jannik-300A-C4 TaxID=2576928 RepID=UPI001BFDABF4|nr:cysteine-rich CWC family protein [Polynucleobacter sp. AP-Jannik-300A-C4]QWE22624.1 cysteine-rich CWC family protein [Polynucleobacter sp. AP-Jannik-300A-C4]